MKPTVPSSAWRFADLVKLPLPLMAVVLFGLLASMGTLAEVAPPPPDAPLNGTKPVRYVVGVSPFLAPQTKNEVYRHLLSLLLETMPRNSSLLIFDAYRIHSIARIEIPDRHAFDSGRTRANQFRQPVEALRQFLAASNPPPTAPELDLQVALRIPQFLDFIAENQVDAEHATRVVLLGSPLHLDDKEPTFSMARGYFPSDGHLLAVRERSVYGTADRKDQLAGVEVRLGYFGDPWISDLHRHRVARFWQHFIGCQGGRLTVLTADLPTLFQGLGDRGTESPASPTASFEPIDPANTKLEMLRLTREIASLDWIAQDHPHNTAHQPPTRTVGPLKIGIRWQGNLDLDLYARADPRAERLYFEQPRAAEGYYYKDHRTSPDREYEFVEFTRPVDLHAVEAAVSFYQGSAPSGAEGEVRLEFDGRIYSGRFRIEADHGNQGREGAGQAPFWARLDIPQVLGLR